MWVKCKACRGKGRVTLICDNDIEVDCINCRGKGGFRVPRGKEVCPDCRGSGRKSLPASFAIYFGGGITQFCKRCNGTGLSNLKR